MKTDMEENSGKVKADLGLLQSDQKVTAEEIKYIDETLKETVRELKPLTLEFKPLLADIQATVDVLKDVQMKHQVKLEFFLIIFHFLSMWCKKGVNMDPVVCNIRYILN